MVIGYKRVLLNEYLLPDDQKDVFARTDLNRYLMTIIAFLKNIAKVLHQFLRYGIITQVATYVILNIRTPFFSEKRSFFEKLSVFRATFGTKRHRLTVPMLQTRNLGYNCENFSSANQNRSP